MTTPAAGSPAPRQDLDDVLRDARQRFIAGFPLTCASLETLIAQARSTRDPCSVSSLKPLAHRLTGLAGTVGFPAVSREASRLEALACTDGGVSFDADAAAAAITAMRGAFEIEVARAPAWSTPDPVPDAKGSTILVVEDEADQRAIMSGALRRAGYTAVEVISGDLALAAACEHHPAAIVLDIALPGLDGFTICRQLKAAPDLAAIPVIFVTTGPNLDDRLMGLWLGADEFLTKPVDMRELILRVRLAVKRAAPAAPEAAPPVAARPAAVAACQKVVLVAEDDPDVAHIVDAEMRAAGFRTLLAFDGQQALTLLAQEPDLLILDLMLPKLTGFELLASLSGSPRSFRILVLSARAREEDVTRAFALGADDYVVKPFSLHELRARVARLLR